MAVAKILLIAQGEYVARYADILKKQLRQPNELDVTVAHMEDAIHVAEESVRTGTEVVIARATTANMLRKAGIPVSVVELPISNDEVYSSIEKARARATPGTAIGFLGFQSAIRSLLPFFKNFDPPVILYEVGSSAQSREQIQRAKRDGITVLIGGERSSALIEEAGLQPVLMETSLASISAAYRTAEEILNALALEKKKNQESLAILDSVSDAIFTIDPECRLIMCNRHAGDMFGRAPEELREQDIGLFFSGKERESIRAATAAGEEIMGAIIERPSTKYAMRMVPVVVDSRPVGAVVTLQEIAALQRMEVTVRKGLYHKGNVARYVFDDILGKSPAIVEAVGTARSFARLHSNALIIGETGTGKELFAQSIHNASPRRGGPFVAVNCGAIPADLVESELFGYEDGAFTGSKKGGKMGLFEIAHGGSIFLDEISEMAPGGQVNLLRALQERQIRRVGGNTPIPVDVRVLAACNAELGDMVRRGRFRRDLFYRLSVLVMKVPPLRERIGDVSLLAAHFLEVYGRRFEKKATLAADALRWLESYSWDGNIRQLRNFCERLAAIAEEPVICGEFVRAQLSDSFWLNPPEVEISLSPAPGEAHPAPRNDIESVMIRGRLHTRSQLEELLAKHRGNREAVAAELDIGRTSLWKLMKKLRF